MLEIQGVDQLVNLSKALKAAGNTELKRELSKSITAAMKPVIRDVRASAVRTLPTRGGLGKRVARTPMRTVRRTGSRVAGIRLQAKSSYHLGQLDIGRARHPVFGNRGVWVTQRVTPGWWTRPTEAAAPHTRRELLAAMERVADKIERAA